MTLAEYINNLGMDVEAKTLEDGLTEIKFTNVEQDFTFCVQTSGGIYDYYDGFDIEEEVYNWLQAKEHGVEGIPYVTELVEEEQLIEDTLHDLAIKTYHFEEALL